MGAIVITGSEKAFAAGADIKQMQSKSYMDTFSEDFFADWDALDARSEAHHRGRGRLRARRRLRAGHDVRLHSCSRQREVRASRKLRWVSYRGMGGSQRLTRFVGKSKAMDMCLTGRMMDAEEAERSGLVSRVVPVNDLLEETLKVAGKIADLSLPSVILAKEAVNRSYETTLAEGLRFERRVFHSLFATEDQKEGMAAFVEKRSPSFQNR